MRYVVYVLYSLKDKRLYVGQTSNLYSRAHLHFRGLVKATKNRRPLEIIHKEYFSSRRTAMEREKFLKSLWGAREKSKILKEYLKLKYDGLKHKS